MHISGNFKCQLSFNLQLILIKIYATQSWLINNIGKQDH